MPPLEYPLFRPLNIKPQGKLTDHGSSTTTEVAATTTALRVVPSASFRHVGILSESQAAIKINNPPHITDASKYIARKQVAMPHSARTTCRHAADRKHIGIPGHPIADEVANAVHNSPPEEKTPISRRAIRKRRFVATKVEF